jgi:hypothetical protein
MSWSYSGDPATSPLDQCRFWLQDIDTTYQLMQDEELLWLIEMADPMQAAPLYAASLAAEVLANRYAKEVSVSADGVSVAVGDLQEKFNKLAENLRAQWHEVVAALGDYDFAGIVIDVNTWDETIQPLVFGIGFMDNYLAGQQDFGYYSPGGYDKELSAESGGGTRSAKTKNPATNDVVHAQRDATNESTP